MEEPVPAKHFVSTIMVNVDNEKMSDADFRQMIRNTLPIVEKEPIEKIVEAHHKSIKKYYVWKLKFPMLK